MKPLKSTHHKRSSQRRFKRFQQGSRMKMKQSPKKRKEFPANTMGNFFIICRIRERLHKKRKMRKHSLTNQERVSHTNILFNITKNLKARK
jgi:hypothetical protein